MTIVDLREFVAGSCCGCGLKDCDHSARAKASRLALLAALDVVDMASRDSDECPETVRAKLEAFDALVTR